MYLNVTQEMIDKAEKARDGGEGYHINCHCVIAEALSHVFPDLAPVVMPNQAALHPKGEDGQPLREDFGSLKHAVFAPAVKVVYLSRPTADYIRRFDMKKPIQPRRFRIEVVNV